MECLEGRISVLAALQARQRKIDVILINHGIHEEKIQDVLDAAQALNTPIKRVDRRELDALAHGTTHGGVLAICTAKPRVSESELLAMLDSAGAPANPMMLLIEGIEDARNLGFTLRSAEALGAAAVLIKKHLWDFDATEIARPASGAYERMKMVQLEDVKLLEKLQRRGLKLLGCVAGDWRRTIYQADLSGPVILAIGGEKRGLSGAVRDICDGLVTIPTLLGASSLSLSHAAAIILSEAHRQRGCPGSRPS